MSTYATVPIVHHVPIDRIRAASAYGSGLVSSPLGRWYKAFSVVYAFPKIVSFIAEILSNERLAVLSKQEASELYLPLAALHQHLESIIAGYERRSWITRIIFRGWSRRMRISNDRIGDIAEALAWAADPELRKIIDEALNSIEQREFDLT